MRFPTIIALILFATTTLAQITPFEKSNGKETTTYSAAISFYRQLAQSYPKKAKLLRYGNTDFGKPLHLFLLSSEGIFDSKKVKLAHKSVLLINNGIHPGEPEGIDASMMLARDLLKQNRLPKNVVIAIIPLYNIGGSFNRSATSRANQNGPLAYGFRGNSKNLDLNRDFIKTDSKNSASFQQIFNTWQPEVFIDTHTSNGSDYQYTQTLIPTQKDKLNPVLSEYLTQQMLPYLYQQMQQKGTELVPYVNAVNETPDDGIIGFLESPRYSTGYAALHNVIGFMPETHMLKSFDKRVEANYKLLETFIAFVDKDAHKIINLKKKADELTAREELFPLNWELDTTKFSTINFKGFSAKYKTSEVSSKERLYYDRNAPYTKAIKQWDNFKATNIIQKPAAYYIPQAWDKVINLLQQNQVSLQPLKKDTVLSLEMYYITGMKTSPQPYEGHYLHSQVKVFSKVQKIQCYAGDYLAYTNQKSNRYLIETLEPQAPDSFFAWNFFDSVLGQKEYFSSYVFEDTAAELLKNDPELAKLFETEKLINPEITKNGYSQLNFIYKNSPYYEKTFMRYPIGRLNQK